MTWLALLLAVGATTRLTRLLVADQFPPVLALRSVLLRRVGGQHWAWTLVSCPWCCSFWIGLPAAAAALYAGHSGWFLIPAAALTASWFAGAGHTVLEPVSIGDELVPLPRSPLRGL